MWLSDVPARAGAALLLSLLCAAAGAADLDQVKARGVLDVAVYANFPPYAYTEGGRTVGVDVDLGRALAQALGVSASIRAVAADETMGDDLRNNVWKGHYLGGGTADVMMHVPVDAEFARENDRVKIFGAYHREEIALAWDPERTGDLSTLELLSRHRVGVELDTLADFYLLGAMGGRLRPNVVHFRSVGEAAAALRAGEVRAVMGPRTEVEGALGSDRAGLKIVKMHMPGMRGAAWDMGIAVKEGNDALARALDAAMARLREDGTVAEVFRRYGLTYVGPAAASLAVRIEH